MAIQPILVDEEAGESYQGLRMTPEDYAAVPKTINSYELVDGVIIQAFRGKPLNVVGYDPNRQIYHGVRMSTDEYLALGETYERYELIDGVVVMFPSYSLRHQVVLGELLFQIAGFLDNSTVGMAVPSVDVPLRSVTGKEAVYCPDMLFVRQERYDPTSDRMTVVPDWIVEVISPHSRQKDTITKKDDYERNGVAEYWLIDWEKETTTFYRLVSDRYVEIPCPGDRFESQAVPGFVLDVGAVRGKFRAI